MWSHFQEILGYILSTIGTIESAIGSTPFPFLTEGDKFHLKVVGNALQAVGSGLAADGQGSPVSFEKLGDEIQAIGNSSVLVGLLVKFQDDADKKFIITGNWMQALGSAIGIADEFVDSTASGRIETINGNLLQTIGNSLQAVDEMNQLHKTITPSNQSLGVVGSWIQAVGSVLSLIGQIKEEIEEIQLNINE